MLVNFLIQNIQHFTPHYTIDEIFSHIRNTYIPDITTTFILV